MIFAKEQGIERAFLFAKQSHESVGQLIKYTGEPYIIHPVSVAIMVSGVHHTDEMLAAALLHDTVEDTPVTLCEIREAFGQPVVLSGCCVKGRAGRILG